MNKATLRLSGIFLQPFPVFRGVYTSMDKSAEGELKSTINTTPVRNTPLEHKQQLHKIFMQQGPGPFKISVNKVSRHKSDFGTDSYLTSKS